jgi:transcriptional regulator ATRX
MNLIGANRVVIFDHAHNPTHEVQAISRAYRYGQRKKVTVYRFVAAGSLEEKIYTRQCTKLTMFRRVVDEEHMKLVTRRLPCSLRV